MKLLVIGATGATGRQVVAQALEHGHHVTAFVRSPARLPLTHDRLRTIVGDVTTDGPALAQAVAGQDVVISALGVGQSLKSGGLIAASAPKIVGAMKTAGVRRLIFTSAYGVGTTYADVPTLPRILMRVLLRDVYADKAAGDAAIRASALDWTIVYPVTLTNGPRTGSYRTGERLTLRGLPKVARADVAEFLVALVNDRASVQKGRLISS